MYGESLSTYMIPKHTECNMLHQLSSVILTSIKGYTAVNCQQNSCYSKEYVEAYIQWLLHIALATYRK